MKIVMWIAAAAALAGCAGKQEYVRPTAAAPLENFKVINRPRSEVWDAAVPALGKQFFVINNLDKASGLINLSYSGDPQRYVDCGRIISFVKNARGERTYDFAGASPRMDYEMMVDGAHLIWMSRRLDLDGRINLIFEDLGDKTRVTANTRYALKRDVTVRDVAGNSRSTSDSIAFNSNGSGEFPQAKVLEGAMCRPTGELERELLQNVK